MGHKERDLKLDILPEMYSYRDDGCEIMSSCLQCPLPQCKYDDPGWLQREARGQRDENIREVRNKEKLTVPELAKRFGISERTVFRAVQRGKGASKGAISGQ